MGDVINAGVGLLVGLLCGYFFEHRATKAAHEHAEQLERELAEIRHSVLSMGGSLPEERVKDGDKDLVRLVRERALAIQNSEGKVQKSMVTSHLLSMGFGTESIDAAIRAWCSSGEAEEVQKWLVLR